MNMKSLLKTIFTIIIAVSILHGCNSEVFISDFAPSINEVLLSEKDSVIVRLGCTVSIFYR